MDPIGAGLMSGGLGILGNVVSANMQRQTAEGLMASQQGFAERMADTQYQRGVADLKAAGLNPMLAYMNSAAPSPQGSMPSASTTNMGGALQQGVSTAIDAARLQNETKQADAQAQQAISNAHLNEWKSLTEVSNAASAKEDSRMASYSRDVMEQRMSSMAQKAQNDLTQEQFRAKFLPIDQYNQRVQGMLGTANSAASLVKPFTQGPTPQSPTGYDDSHINPGTGEIYKETQRRYRYDQ